MFQDDLIAMAHVYLAANATLLEGEREMYTEPDGLTPAARGRLEGWRTLAERNVLIQWSEADGEHFWSQDVDMCVVNVQQNDYYFKKLGTEVMPALMRKSLLWDLVRERAVSVAEGWLIQGVPHPDVVALDELTRSKCPYGGGYLLVSASERTLRP